MTNEQQNIHPAPSEGNFFDRMTSGEKLMAVLLLIFAFPIGIIYCVVIATTTSEIKPPTTLSKVVSAIIVVLSIAVLVTLVTLFIVGVQSGNIVFG